MGQKKEERQRGDIMRAFRLMHAIMLIRNHQQLKSASVLLRFTTAKSFNGKPNFALRKSHAEQSIRPILQEECA